MSKNSMPHQFLPEILTVLALVAGCATVDGTTPKIVSTPKEDAKAAIERWKCGDYFDGCGFLATDCVTLTANLHTGTGEVKFGNFTQATRFIVEGIERRWDWCMDSDGFYDCAFVVSVDGKGKYFNFRGSDGQARPKDIFKCEKR